MATLGDQAVGSIVKLNVGGTATDFIVVHQGLPSSVYDSSCNGTWLLAKDICEKRAWHTENINNYEVSAIHSYLQSTFIDKFDTGIRDLIQQVKIPYTKGVGETGSLKTKSNGLPAKIFLLSVTEIGYAPSSANVEGTTLAYFEGASKNTWTAYYNGVKTAWWTRSPYTKGTTWPWRTGADTGSGMNYTNATSSEGIRPAMVMSMECEVDSSGFVTISSGGISGTVNIGGVERELTGKGYINIGGVLHDLADSNVNIGGTMKSTKG